MACRIFPDQGSNPCLLHWQVDSLSLSHQGSPIFRLFLISVIVFLNFDWFFLMFSKSFQWSSHGIPAFFSCVLWRFLWTFLWTFYQVNYLHVIRVFSLGFYFILLFGTFSFVSLWWDGWSWSGRGSGGVPQGLKWWDSQTHPAFKRPSAVPCLAGALEVRKQVCFFLFSCIFQVPFKLLVFCCVPG